MSTLSTHVLDTALGCPAAGMSIKLEILNGEIWSEISHSVTNDDGRVTDLMKGQDKLLEGVYRLRFDTAAYFALSERPCFYPYVEIVFQINNQSEHYHVPLLVSGFGYSSYRGS